MSAAEKPVLSGTGACESHRLAQITPWYQDPQEKPELSQVVRHGTRRIFICLQEPCVTFLSAKLACKWYFFCSYCWPCQTFATKSFVEAWNSTDCKADEMLGHARFTHQQLPFMSECVFCTPSLLRCQGQGGCKKHNASQGSEKHVHKMSAVPAHI